jgi:hypothetical protein
MRLRFVRFRRLRVDPEWRLRIKLRIVVGCQEDSLYLCLYSIGLTLSNVGLDFLADSI